LLNRTKQTTTNFLFENIGIKVIPIYVSSRAVRIAYLSNAALHQQVNDLQEEVDDLKEELKELREIIHQQNRKIDKFEKLSIEEREFPEDVSVKKLTLSKVSKELKLPADVPVKKFSPSKVSKELKLSADVPVKKLALPPKTSEPAILTRSKRDIPEMRSLRSINKIKISEMNKSLRGDKK